MLDQGSPGTFWLNLTNVGLGVVTLACLLTAARAFFKDVLDRLCATRDAEEDARRFSVPGLGTTMADGGHPLPKDPADRKERRRFGDAPARVVVKKRDMGSGSR